MPGFVLHLVAAKMLLEHLEDDVEENEFLLGNLLPDAAKDKARSHFHNPIQCNQIIRYPELDVFLIKYKPLMKNSIVLGYFYHLYIDRKFYKDFLREIVTFLNEYGQEESEREKIVWALVKRTGQKIPIKQFYSNEYYYGDFTKMNAYLVKQYRISMEFNPNIENPGIDEVDVQDISQVLEQMKEYIYLSDKMGSELKVFDIQTLLAFLEKIAKEWKNKGNKKLWKNFI